MKPNIKASMVSWEADYGDGIVAREDQGAMYAEIDRGKLKSFRIVNGNVTYMEYWVTDASKFVYRRRTAMSPNGISTVQFIVGEFNGSVSIYDVTSGEIIFGSFEMQHPVGMFDMPVPIPEAGEMF